MRNTDTLSMLILLYQLSLFHTQYTIHLMYSTRQTPSASVMKTIKLREKNG